VIPNRATAHITCRLVPDQDPDRIFAAIATHIASAAPAAVRVSVEQQPGAVPAYAIASDHPAVVAALGALRSVYTDQEPLLVRIGGTLPAAVLFERQLGLKTLLFSFSTADENLHAPNEFFRLARLDEGVAAWSALLRRLA
jgi:acetylornithine deacetylase/succinyl-diaminopimelate desuccinylase-like protein